MAIVKGIQPVLNPDRLMQSDRDDAAARAPRRIQRWFERLAVWAEAQPQHHRMGSWERLACRLPVDSNVTRE
jgi:hypothetical protein